MVHEAYAQSSLKVKVKVVMSNSLQPHELYSPWNSPDQNTGVGSLSLLQKWVPEWVAFPFSRESALQADSLPAMPQGKPQSSSPAFKFN